MSKLADQVPEPLNPLTVQTTLVLVNVPPPVMFCGAVRLVCAGNTSVTVMVSLPVKLVYDRRTVTGMLPSSPETLVGMILVTDAEGGLITRAKLTPIGPVNGVPQASS